MVTEIVDLSINSMVISQSYVNVYQRVYPLIAEYWYHPLSTTRHYDEPLFTMTNTINHYS